MQTNGTINTSDRQAKKNFQSISCGLEEVLAINAVQYHWNENSESEPQHLGVIAQELASILPELVLTPQDDDTLLGVRYTELIPILVKAIQESNKKK